MTEPRIEWFDELSAEFSRVATEASNSKNGRLSPSALLALTSRRTMAICLSGLVLVVGGVYAVPVTRAAINDITSAFTAWIAGDEEQAPGRAVRPEDDAPDWVRESGGRLIAKTDGVGLYVTRARSEAHGTVLTFSLGNGNAFIDSVDGWRERFKEHALFVLGTTPDTSGEPESERERMPLLGLTARSVERVALQYADGPPLVSNGVRGGFVLIADGRRSPRAIVAYDAAGRELERVDVSGNRVGAFGVAGQD
jgi:hypothetical protein